MKKIGKRGIACVLSAVMIIGAMPVSVVAEEENTPKEEVVYVNLQPNGEVSEIYVVNSFDVAQSGKIIDYGDYEQLRNMNSSAPIEYKDGQIVIESDGGEIYYEGLLNSTHLPWVFDIHYFMDGKEYTAEEIAGKSGKLKITLEVRKNESGDSWFFDNYALQASCTLDTKSCKNIIAKGATQANVGSDRQLTYMILPGNEGNYEITADVTDFEMSGISVNGLVMSLDIDVDDEEIMDQVEELLDGIKRIDDGAGALEEGAGQIEGSVQSDLKSGTDALDNGIQELESGARSLKENGSSLQEGTLSVQNGMNELDKGIQNLNTGIMKMHQALEVLDSNSESLSCGADQIQAAIGQIQEALKGVDVSAEELEKLIMASEQIRDSLDLLVANGRILRQGMSFEAYNAKMKENGLDVVQLRIKNGEAIVMVKGMIDVLEQQIELLSQDGETKSQETYSAQESIPKKTPEKTETSYTEPISEETEPISEETEPSYTESVLEETQPSYEEPIPEDTQSISVETEPVITEESPVSEETEIIAKLEPVERTSLSAGSKSDNAAQIAVLQKQIEQLEQIIVLLEENTAAINGTEVYLGELNEHMGQYIDNMQVLQKKYAEFDESIKKLTDTLTNLMGQIGVLSDGIDQLMAEQNNFNNGLKSYTKGVSEIMAASAQIQEGAALLVDGSSSLTAGTNDLYAGVEAYLKGIEAFYTATGTLKDGSGKLNQGVEELLAGIVALREGSQTLKEGTEEMKERTQGMDEEINDKIDELVGSVSGDKDQVISFVSDQNKNVDAVQFVIKTESISIAEEEKSAQTETEEDSGLWNKIMRLFVHD